MAKKKRIGEWTDLTITNIPKDLFELEPYHQDNVYQMKESSSRNEWSDCDNYVNHNFGTILENLTKGSEQKVYYRLRITPPPKPSHKDIMTYFWNFNDNIWGKVEFYDSLNNIYICGQRNLSAYDFNGMNGVILPPEKIEE